MSMNLFGGGNKPLFGSAPATTSSGFSFGTASSSTAAAPLFGSTTTTSTAKPLFGSTTQASSTPSLFGSTATVSAAPSGGGLFGSAATSTATSAFSTTPSGSLFAKRTATGTGTGLFGSSTATPATGGGLFSNTTSGGLFGSKPATTGGLFGSTAVAQPQNQTKEVETIQGILINSDSLVRSLTKPEYFGDERDTIIAKLNQLAAALGVGQGVHRRDQPPVNYENGIFFRYKAIGYNKVSELTDEDGIVSLITKKPKTSLITATEKQAFLDAIFAIIGNNPNLKPHFMENGIKSLSDGTTEVCIYIKENGQTMSSRKVAQALGQLNIAQQLETQLQVDKTRILPKVAMSTKQKEAYLRDAPSGFDSVLWKQAVMENPDSKNLIPYPIRGFDQLKERQKAQASEVEMQNKALDSMHRRTAKLQEAHTKASLRMTQQKATQKQLSHRLLRVLAMQLVTHRYSQCISSEEEQIFAALEHINARLAAPNQIRDKISDLTEKLKNHADKVASHNQDNYHLSEDDSQQLRKYLLRCQEGLESLLSVISANRRDLQAISNYIY